MIKQYIKRKNGNLYLVGDLYVDNIFRKRFVFFIGFDYDFRMNEEGYVEE